MTHQVLQSVLAAQKANALIAGRDLRTAAENLIRLANDRMCVKAFDAAGERVIGAALLLTDSLSSWDYTMAFPANRICLLVGGVVAGPAGIAAAAAEAHAAGALSVDVAILGGWTRQIPGVSRIQVIGVAHVQVA